MQEINPCFLLFYEVEIITKTTKMTNPRGHNFTLINLTLKHEMSTMFQLILNTCVYLYTFKSFMLQKKMINYNTTSPKLSPMSKISFQICEMPV